MMRLTNRDSIEISLLGKMTQLSSCDTLHHKNRKRHDSLERSYESSTVMIMSVKVLL